MRLLIAITALLLVASCVAAADYDKMFGDFKAKYGRVYSSASEHARRQAIFTDNMKKAAELQKLNPLATFGVNDFSDLSVDEFKVRHNAQNHYASAAKKTGPAPDTGAALPAPVDWRKKGAVTYVKNQGQCGSCWSFSTTGSIEGQWFLAGNKLTALSEQEMVSCDTTDNGCSGGLMDNAFNWLVNNRNGQIFTEASYPYVSGEGSVPSCDMSNKVVGATINGHQDIAHDELTMAKRLETQGPLSVAVDATTWQTYTGGIISNCQSVQLDHGVLIVGFDGSGSMPYWIIKNSWGPSWGEQGFLRVKYGSNECLINNYPTTSLVNGSAPPAPPAPTPPAPAPTPSPAPTKPMGTFTQKQCSDAKCSQSCVSHTFPQGTCLALESGGSAVATCEPTELQLKVYPMSSTCTGMSTTQSNPINQCLQSQNGGYFENVCSNTAAVQLAAASVALRHVQKY